MKTIGHPLFLIIAGLYIIYYGLKQSSLALPPFVSSYFADLVSLFIINTIALFLMRKFFKKPKLELSISMVLFSLTAVSLVFEWYQPMINAAFVSDPADILCYSLSALFYIVWRRNWKLF